ncbi:unnamed protein product [Rangifer tarandus platyrhynchus]|uniref:Uncharacterized protein n=2 Tax=Rangifer tarandus platyrhynchus TaxID=3082113 RepID=A0ABN8ZIX3_RANTA|nr:unnamed protein product [Rangifer tarandus platyrhynchus]
MSHWNYVRTQWVRKRVSEAGGSHQCPRGSQQTGELGEGTPNLVFNVKMTSTTSYLLGTRTRSSWRISVNSMTGQAFPGLTVSFMREITLKRKIHEVRTMGNPVIGWQAIASCLGEGNGTPLQFSCLENPMDGGA